MLCCNHFGAGKLSFLKNLTILAVVQSLAYHFDVLSNCLVAGVDESRQVPLLVCVPRVGQVPTCLWLNRNSRRANDSANEGRSSLSDRVARGVAGCSHLPNLVYDVCINLAYVHCLSSSGELDLRELSTFAIQGHH